MDEGNLVWWGSRASARTFLMAKQAIGGVSSIKALGAEVEETTPWWWGSMICTGGVQGYCEGSVMAPREGD